MKSTITFVKILSTFFIINTVIIHAVFAQGPDTLWTKTFGGVAYENGFCVRQTSDEGYIVVGYTQSYGSGSNDVYLIKTDADGNEQWSKTYGGTEEDRGYDVHQTSDDGYVVFGRTESFGAGLSDYYLIKTDADGNEQWSKTYGGTDYDRGNKMLISSDGGYILVGRTVSYGAGVWDIYMIKTDANGNEEWSNTYGGSNSEYGNNVLQANDGGYIIVGETESYGVGYSDIYLVKTDSGGNELWYKTFGDAEWDYGSSVQNTPEGGYIIAGYTWSFYAGQGYDAYLVKTDADGNELWTRQYDGSNSDYIYEVLVTPEGDYVVGGHSLSPYQFNYDFYLFKTDKDGNVMWTQQFGGDDDEYARSLQQTSDGGFIMTGRTDSYGAGDGDIWLVKIVPDATGIDNDSFNDSSENNILKQNHPNPFDHHTSISYTVPHSAFINLTVYDKNGGVIKTLVNEFKVTGTYCISFETDISSGTYYYSIIAGNEMIETKKMLIIK
ncbi:MAG: hypothetical protein ABFS05_01560 [Bacteroidota bacterium]